MYEMYKNNDKKMLNVWSLEKVLDEIIEKNVLLRSLLILFSILSGKVIRTHSLCSNTYLSKHDWVIVFKCLFIGTRYRVQITKLLNTMSSCLNAWLSVHDWPSVTYA